MKTITYLHIPEDLIYDIFLRLPVKSLLRFKCISKIWLALITNQDFVRKHLLWEGHKTTFLAYWLRVIYCERPPDNNVFTLFVDETLDRYDVLDHLKIHPLVSAIRGPCNGVFCILSRYFNMALLNPATRRMKPLPAHPREFGLVNEVALGFDPLNDEFKVILIAAEYFMYEYPYFAIYTSSNDSWRLVQSEALTAREAYIRVTRSGTAFLNRFYYWFGYDTGTRTSNILEFDMHDEVFEQIEIPEIARSFSRGDLSIYEGSLVLFAYDLYIQIESMDIWTMKGKGCWTKLLTYVPSISRVAYSFGFWTKNKIIFLYGRRPTELVVYDLNFRQTKRLKIEKVGVHHFDEVWVYYYKESVVSVKAGCESRDYEIDSTEAQDFFTRKTWEVDDLL